MDVIVSRLDFTYGSKRLIYVIEKKIGTLRQTTWTFDYYDEVEKKFTLLIYKVNMSYKSAAA